MSPNVSSSRSLLSCFSIFFVLLLACDGNGGSDSPEPNTLCPASFAFRPSVSVNSVYVVGGWNGFDRSAHSMDGPDGTGTYTSNLEIEPGEWGYFFLVDGMVTLDPSAAETITSGSETYSHVEVVCEEDIHVSLALLEGSLKIERHASGQGMARATLAIERTGNINALELTGRLDKVGGSSRALTGSELGLSSDRRKANLSLINLSDGKYDLHIQAKLNTASDSLVLPFSIEPPSFSLSVAHITNDRPAPGLGVFGATISIEHQESLDDFQLSGTLRSMDGSTRALTSAELALSNDRASAVLSLDSLQDGKYNVLIEATSSTYSSDLLLPFWIEAEPFSFYDSPIYMVMTDRFRNGDLSNDSPISGSETPANFQGGDLQGVTQAIEEGYFEALGVRALWLSPWQTQPNRAHDDWISDNLTVHVTGYHGYWPIRAREVEPRLGGADALHALVRAAHARGMRIIMDTVLNHVHEDHEYVLEHPNWFRTSINCKDNDGWGWDNAPLTCMFNTYMPDVDWTNVEASAQFLDDVQWWVEAFDLDGLRVDAVKHMEDDVMGKLGSKMRKRFETAGTDFYMFGETYDGNPDALNKYVGGDQLDGQFDFMRYFDGANQAFLSDGSGLVQVNAATWNSINAFGNAMMVTFIGSHDVPRVISRSDDANRSLTGYTWGSGLPPLSTDQLAYDRVWMAMFHMMTTPGVPLIYYGDEYGEHGGSDPDNRHFMQTVANMSNQQKAQLDRMEKLGQARETLRGLRRGSFETMWVNDEAWGNGSGNLWAYMRRDPKGDPKQSAVLVMNLTENTWAGIGLHSNDSIKLTDLGWTNGTVYDLLTGAEYELRDGAVTVDVPARGGVILGLR